MEEKYRQETSDCIKVVLFGPESTGKTTLSKQLARYYNTKWVPEYMREYLQEKWDTNKEVCTYDDLLPIARGQMDKENRLTKEANHILFCDTNLLELKVYSEIYYENLVPEILNKISLENVYDLYLLTYIDTPWIPDDLRDKPNEREEMFLKFEKTLKKYQLPYIVMKGDEISRFKKAVTIIDQLIEQKK
ncbi:ATP-binding protein [Aquimarina sp. 2201CG5-10]|uniref:ATP-binding protein n=1 Tax=Aquimarina callyspongiae TaxID=3098150 RepID=UPI002AB36DE9|nr:ATP-binding protein [Aquimarina sp. 2201CG5-10]MDY8135037.1 ATP-binding protein [Aquimarina sp. 2201CG5-10]